jgi:hypothetical protein
MKELVLSLLLMAQDPKGGLRPRRLCYCDSIFSSGESAQARVRELFIIGRAITESKQMIYSQPRRRARPGGIRPNRMRRAAEAQTPAAISQNTHPRRSAHRARGTLTESFSVVPRQSANSRGVIHVHPLDARAAKVWKRIEMVERSFDLKRQQ